MSRWIQIHPNPNQFMAALYGTYNIYMDGYTYSTFTCYPSTSLSEEHLLKFVDFYMDGVYHPLVMSGERLTQEAICMDEAVRLTYPGSVVGSETGSVPGFIEIITHEDLVYFHDTYYHPSNSLMVLYGDLDVEPFLELIDQEYLSDFDRKEITLHGNNDHLSRRNRSLVTER